MENKEFLATEPVGRLLRKLAVPAVVAQVVNLLYNMVDRIYIGGFDGTGLALTGVGVCMPVIMIISAFAALVGMGGAPRASILMGKGKDDEAEKTLGGCFFLLLLISLTLTAAFSLAKDPVLRAFGASDATIGYAREYLAIYVLGTVFVQIALGMNAFLSAQGFSADSMVSVLIGAVCNIVLDPVFIFAFHMGVRGAALATVLSQAASAAWVLAFLLGKKTRLKLKRENLVLKGSVVGPCLALGVSPFIMQLTESALSVCFNTSLLRYGGDVAVGSMTVLSTLMQLCMLPLQGLTQGAQPITSYNFGAGNAGRVRQSFRLLLKCCLCYTAVFWLAVMAAPQVFIRLFNRENQQLIAYAAWAARIYFAVVVLMGAQLACQNTLIAIGSAKTSLFLAVLRKLILLIPLIYLLPAILPQKDLAVFLAEPVADFLAVATTVCLFSRQFRRALAQLKSK